MVYFSWIRVTMGNLDGLETNFENKVGPFIQERELMGAEILTLDDNQRCNKYKSGLNESMNKW